MGQSNVKLSDSEENPERNEDDTPNEQQVHRNLDRSGSNNIALKNNEGHLPQRGRYPAKIHPGSSNSKSTHKFQTENKFKGTNWQESNERKRFSEKDYNERIIRDKEKLLKEKEETIRQQAKLIETQNLLLKQRESANKQNHQNVNSSSTNNNAISHQYTMRPLLDTTDLPKFFETHMSVLDDLQVYYAPKHPHASLGQDNLHSDVAGNNYFVNQVDMPNRKFQNIQDYSNETLASSNSQLNHSAVICFPIQHNSDVILSPKVSRRPIFYSSQISNFNIPPKHLTAPFATDIQTKFSLTQNNRTEKRNMQKVDSFDGEIHKEKDANSNESIGDVLKDLEKETNFVLNNLNHDKNEDGCKLINKVKKKNPSNRNPRKVKSMQGFFRCTECSVEWKSKMFHVGASQKCRNCNTDVSSRTVTEHLKDERENLNQTAMIPKIERIYETDD